MSEVEKKLKELREKISEVFSAETTKNFTEFQNKLDVIPKSVENIKNKVEDLGRPVQILGQGFSDSGKSLESFNMLMEDLAIKASLVLEKLPGIGPGLSGGLLGSISLFTETNRQLEELGKTLDGNVESFTKYRDEMYKVGSQFGMTFDQTKKMGQELAQITKNTPDELIIGFSDLKEALEDSARGGSAVGLTLDKLNKTIDTGSGSFNSLNAAILLSRRSGVETSTVMNSLTNAVNRQGTTIEGAITQYSQFLELTKKTGLDIRTVSSGLENAVSGFNKLGMSADFARPLMEGFATSLQKTNLGITNARDLTATLSSAFGSIASSYDKSFIMSQVGGLDTGSTGGGVLSSSIGLRQRIREAKESGSQAEIGLEMGEALKKTLETFGGGEIVTLEDAAKDPSKANLFKIQEDLLSQYGISGDAAANTLDMLKELSSVTMSGNDELKDTLGKQLNEQLEKQDQNSSYQDRISKASENIFASSVLTNEYLDKLVDISIKGGGLIAEGQSTAMRGTFNFGDAMINKTAEGIDSFQEKAREQLKVLSGESERIKNSGISNMLSYNNVSEKDQNKAVSDIRTALENATYNFTIDFSNGQFNVSQSPHSID